MRCTLDFSSPSISLCLGYLWFITCPPKQNILCAHVPTLIGCVALSKHYAQSPYYKVLHFGFYLACQGHVVIKVVIWKMLLTLTLYTFPQCKLHHLIIKHSATYCWRSFSCTPRKETLLNTMYLKHHKYWFERNLVVSE